MWTDGQSDYYRRGRETFHYKDIYRRAAGMGYTSQASKYMNGYHFHFKSISLGYFFHLKRKEKFEKKKVYESIQFRLWELGEKGLFFNFA